MSIAVSGDLRIQDFRVTRDELIAHLADGRVIHVPLVWSWRLAEATPAERANFRILGGGQIVHWPDIDEDISVEGMLGGAPAPRSRYSVATEPSHQVREEGPAYGRKAIKSGRPAKPGKPRKPGRSPRPGKAASLGRRGERTARAPRRTSQV